MPHSHNLPVKFTPSSLAEFKALLPKQGSLMILTDYICEIDSVGALEIAGERLFSIETLNTLDERLGKVVHVLADKGRDCVTKKIFEPYYLNATLDLWERPQHLIDKENAKKEYLHISTIRHKGPSGTKHEELVIGIIQPVVRGAVSANGQTYPIVVALATEKVSVSLPWFNEHYPDWRTRLSTANALDLNYKEKVDYILNINAHPVVLAPTGLPTITFE